MLYKRVNELLETNYKKDSNIDWFDVSSNYKLSEDFIREFKNRLNWTRISRYQTLSESFIREFKDCVNWSNISRYQTLSESFIREFQDKVDWEYISQYQTLSESFIKEFKDRVDWILISNFQLLSWNFILEFEDKVSWYSISSYQPFIEDIYYEKINKEALKYNELYHLFQKTKERGWFWGYVRNKAFLIKSSPFSIRSRIYWKDLALINTIKYFEPIRQVKNV